MMPEKIMMTKSMASRSLFFLCWTASTAVAYAIGILVGFVVGHFFLGNVMVGICVGASVGIAQWFFLRGSVAQVIPWILANVAGMTVSLSLYAVVSFVWGYPFDLGWPWGVLGWGLAFGLGGMIAGLIQQRKLHGHLAEPHWWVIACTIGWGLSALGLSIPPDMSGGYHGLMIIVLILRNIALASAVAGTILGAVTAGALIGMISSQKRRRQGGDPPSREHPSREHPSGDGNRGDGNRGDGNRGDGNRGDQPLKDRFGIRNSGTI